MINRIQMDTSSIVTQETFIGRVKWFNNKSGFGFITLTDGVKSGTDIFAHHSSLKVDGEQYRYLVQGEYVELSLVKMEEGNHEFQAANVCGIKGGKLMCETRNENRVSRIPMMHSKDDQGEPSRRPIIDTRTPPPGFKPRQVSRVKRV